MGWLRQAGMHFTYGRSLFHFHIFILLRACALRIRSPRLCRTFWRKLFAQDSASQARLNKHGNIICIQLKERRAKFRVCAVCAGSAPKRSYGSHFCSHYYSSCPQYLLNTFVAFTRKTSGSIVRDSNVAAVHIASNIVPTYSYTNSNVSAE